MHVEKPRAVHHRDSDLFQGLPNPSDDALSLLNCGACQSCRISLKVTAETEAGEIMGLAHTSLPIRGVQFHPESLQPSQAMQVLENFLQLD